jgi:hypothetical protein
VKRAIIGIGFGAALLADAAAAQTKTGTTILGFLGIEPSARFAAMGNAGGAVADDIQAVHYNPGALGWLGRGAVQFTHGVWFAGIQYDHAALALTLGDWGNASLAVTSLRSGDMEVRTVERPLGTGERFSVRDVAIGLGYGRQITQRFAAGVQLQWASETIWNTGVDLVTASLGTLYRLNDGGLMLGSSLVNVGTRGRFDGRDLAIQFDREPDRYGDNSTLPGSQLTEEFPLPILFRVGLSYPRQVSAQSRLLLSVDALHPSDNTESLDLGWEWTWRDAFSVRGGYQSLYQRDSEFGLTTGLGVRAAAGGRRFQIDYGWAYHAFLEDVHRFTFQLQL